MKAAGAFGGRPRELRDTMTAHIVLVSGERTEAARPRNPRSRLVQPGRTNFGAIWRGRNMPRSIKSGLLAIALCSILVPRAQAAMVPVPTALASGIARAVEGAQYDYGSCREVWRCGRYACGWRQYCRFPPFGRRLCPRGWRIQDGLCKPYRD